MKILNIMFESILNPMGGLGVFVRDTTSELAKMGHEITILGFDPLSINFLDTTVNGCRVLNCKNTNIHQQPRGPYHLLTLNDMFCENLLYHLKDEKFDVVHLHDTLLWSIAKYAAILFKAPIVTHAHLSHALVHADYPMWTQKKFEVTQEVHAYAMSHGIITCSNSYSDMINDYFLIERPFTVCYNGINFEDLQQYKYNGEINNKYGKGQVLIGCVARLVPSKGIELIQEAVKLLPDYSFVLISNVAPSVEKFFPLVQGMKDLQEKHDNFTWVNDLPTNSKEKWEIMVSCDIGLVPSLHEPWGIVSDEWGSLYIPKIVTKVGGLLEHNSDDDSIMIDPTVDSLVDAIKNMDCGPDMINNAWTGAKERTWERTASLVYSEYERTIKARR